MQPEMPHLITRPSFGATRALVPPAEDGPDQAARRLGNFALSRLSTVAGTREPCGSGGPPARTESRNAVLICPAERPGVSALVELASLAVLPVLGKRLIEYWLERLFLRGVREVLVLVTDRPERVRAVVGDGRRWGLRVEVVPEPRELTADEARTKHGAECDDVVVLDHLPGQPGKALFTSYATWFKGVTDGMPTAATPERVGLREVRPGVWVGLHASIASGAELRPPCWIGNLARIGRDATIGPMAVIENRAFIEVGAEVTGSLIGPETYVGRWSEVKDSLAFGETLINWRTGSRVSVPDAFQLCALGDPRADGRAAGPVGRLAALMALALTAPAAAWLMAKARRRGLPALRRAVAVCGRGGATAPRGEVVYHELTEAEGLLRRWPQLWNVAHGEFAWVGNRPLPPAEAASLRHDFERLWLAAPTGLVSLADAEGCPDPFGDEARAHASFYAVRRDWWLDLSILARVLKAAVMSRPRSRRREDPLLAFRGAVAKQQG